MIPRAVGTSVQFFLSPQDPDFYLPILNEAIEANREYDAHRTELGFTDLQQFRERLIAAEDDLEDAFSDTVDIEHAEFVLRMLNKAITEAKVARGDFARGGDE